MIYLNEDGVILVKEKKLNYIEFEDIEMESVKLKLRITTGEWLIKNGYIFIGTI